MNRVQGGRSGKRDSRGSRAILANGDAAGRQPAYLAIVGSLSERISTGAYPPGLRLPSNPELCEEFGVSPMTVRRALTTLKNQGLISCIQGSGSFVRPPDLSRSAFRLASLSGEWLDGSAAVRLLSVSMSRADAKTAALLGVAEGERVVCLRRLVTSHAAPTMYHTEYVAYDPRRPLLESQLQLTSLAGFLEADRGKRFTEGELTVRAVNLDAESSEALGESEGAAALRLDHVSRDTSGLPVSWGYFLLRADLFLLSAQLGNTSPLMG